ncbi:MAG: hypothetical protein QOE94_2413 [Mycobacterium sp.]|nr:hypothetical protein [Mycobacterium sp.]
MDIVLGVSMAPTMVRMVLVEGENADGVTVEEDNFDVVAADDAATSGAPQQVIAAILGTREGAAEGGYRLVSTGVTWTEPTEIGALRDALAFCEMRSVMLVSPLLAAAALTQTVGDAMDYEYTALLFVEPGSATLAVVKTNDGSIVDLYRQRVHCSGRGAEAVTDLAAMVSAVDGLEARPDGVFVVGCGVDIVPIKRKLDATVSIPVSAPEEPDMALARGAALASANAPLFASSTAALAYAQDPGTGEVNPSALAPAYLGASANARLDDSALAYSAFADDEVDKGLRGQRPFLLASSGAAAVVLIGIVALAIALVGDVGPTVGRRTSHTENAVPTTQVPAPPSAPAPAIAAPGSSAPPAAPPPAAPPPSAAPLQPPPIAAPTPVVHQSPQRALTPNPVYRAPTRQAPVYIPPPAADEAPPPAAPPPPPPAAAPPAPPEPRLPPMVMYLHLPFVTVPIPINPPPPPPPPGP